MCDMPGNLDDTLALAALIHCLVKALSDEIDPGAYQHDCHPMMVRQNKWRAARFGVGAQLVDTFTFEVQTLPQIVDGLVDKLHPAADELGCTEYLERCRQMAAGPTWADRQLALAQETGSLEEVVRRLTRESRITPVPSAEQNGPQRAASPQFPTATLSDSSTPTI
jgi:carboxylate-amine ligase